MWVVVFWHPANRQQNFIILALDPPIPQLLLGDKWMCMENDKYLR